MPYISNQGVRIYYEVHGEGEPLVLLHGFTSNMLRWKTCGYVDALKQSHKVIVVDLRGHGRSDKPHDHAAYSLEHRLADITAVLNAAGASSAHFCGYSMGGWLAFGMAVHHPQSVKSLIIGGAHPYREKLEAFYGIDGLDPDAFILAQERFIGEEINGESKQLILQNDLVAMTAAARDRDGFEPDLGRIDVPVLLFVGDLDKRHALVLRTAAALPGAQLIVLPGAYHATALFFSERLLPEIDRFLKEHRAAPAPLRARKGNA